MQTLRHLKITHYSDPFFSMEYSGSVCGTMIAPGLVHVYNIRFSPMEKRDYEYRIEFVSDVDVFTVPIIGERTEICHVVTLLGEILYSVIVSLYRFSYRLETSLRYSRSDRDTDNCRENSLVEGHHDT